jgi:hypothetical protein
MVTGCPPTKMPVRNRRLTFILLAFVLATVTAIVAVGTFLPCLIWDGHFALNLDVFSLSGKQVSKVLYAPCFDQHSADWLATDRSEASHCEFRQAAKGPDGFLAEVRCSGKTNFFNFELSYVEYGYIVVEVTDEKGNTIRKSLHIPAGRGTRTLEILIP